MPFRFVVDRFDPADDDLHRLAGQGVELFRKQQDLVRFDLLLMSHVNEANKDAEEELFTSLRDRQDLHPAAGYTVTSTSNELSKNLFPSIEIHEPTCNLRCFWQFPTNKK